MRVLAIDTALGQCAAGVIETNEPEPLGAEILLMERGHAEALLPLLDRVISQVEGRFSGLERVVVTVGPGSFTGLRVGIAAARAIGLAAGVPVVGVTTLAALMAPFFEQRRARLVAAAIDARGGRVFAQAMAPGGRIVVKPGLMGVRDLVRALGNGTVTIVGSGAPAVAAEAWGVGLDARVHEGSLAPDLAWIARLGAAADPRTALPKPYYLAQPDARPQEGARLARL
jgi:tRNA threonylcarbamoyl adenosine modification protein YeaZ